MVGYPDSVPAVKLSFDLADAFPLDDPMSLPLLRLMAATNDTLLIQKQTIIAKARVATVGELDRSLLNGELLYHFRMLYGHLSEAGIAFRQADELLRTHIDALLNNDSEAKTALKQLREIYWDESEGGFCKGVLGRVRNLASFHYKEAQFRDGVAAFGTSEAHIILSRHRGIGRYVVTDEIINRSVWEFVGGTKEGFFACYGKAIRLADSLGVAVSHLVSQRLEQKGIRLVTHEGTLKVEPELNEVRQSVENDRGPTA